MIKIPLHVLSDEWSVFDGVEPDSFLDLPDNGIVRCPHETHYRLRAQLVSGGILVEGEAETVIEAQCGRCLCDFSRTVAARKICHFYEDITHDLLDVTDDIREDVILAMPVNPLCGEDCRGLCPDCGVDLNSEQCACHRKRNNGSAWKDLDDFKFEN